MLKPEENKNNQAENANTTTFNSSTNRKNTSSESGANGQSQPTFQPPVINLPKGGGAIQGIGEKFQANPVTGTGSMSVPIAMSPGRGGFTPQLALSYDSGAGNSCFGLGWNVGLPSISRKTQTGLSQYDGLPHYYDACNSDVFILSGVEDLIPVLENIGTEEEKPYTRIDGAYKVLSLIHI